MAKTTLDHQEFHKKVKKWDNIMILHTTKLKTRLISIVSQPIKVVVVVVLVVFNKT